MNIYVSAVLAVFSVLAYAAGAVQQLRLARRQRSSTTAWCWALGLNLTGAVLHVMALRYGPLSIVQPIGALTLVVALAASAGVFHHRIRVSQWWGTILTVAAVAGLAAVSRPAHHARQLTNNNTAVILGLGTVVTAVLLVIAARTRRPLLRSLSYSTIAGLSFAVGSALAQTLALKLTQLGWERVVSVATILQVAAVMVAAGAGMVAVQASYRFGMAAQLGTNTFVDAAGSYIIGVTLLGEQRLAGAVGTVMVVVAGFTAAAGLFLLARGSRPTPGQQTPGIVEGSRIPQAATERVPAVRAAS